MRAVVALGTSLIILSCLFFYFSFGRYERRDTVAGNPPVLSSAVSEAPERDCPPLDEGVAISEETKQLHKAESVPLKEPPGGWLRTLSFEARVQDQSGVPVSGAWMFARMAAYDTEGHPVPRSMDFRTDGTTTDEEGVITCSASYSRDTRADEVFEVFAYNPRLGLGFVASTLEQLTTLGEEGLVVNVERGESVVGQILDESGQAFAGARVTLYMESHSGINLSGLGAVTNEDGSFSLCGVTLENTPILVVASYDHRKRMPTNPELPVSASNPMVRTGSVISSRKAIERRHFDAETATWSVGEIVLSRSEQGGSETLVPLSASIGNPEEQ
jgi:hypothetical protein